MCRRSPVDQSLGSVPPTGRVSRPRTGSGPSGGRAIASCPRRPAAWVAGTDEASLVEVRGLRPYMVHVCGVHRVASRASSSVTSQHHPSSCWAQGPAGLSHPEAIKTFGCIFLAGLPSLGSPKALGRRAKPDGNLLQGAGWSKQLGRRGVEMPGQGPSLVAREGRVSAPRHSWVSRPPWPTPGTPARTGPPTAARPGLSLSPCLLRQPPGCSLTLIPVRRPQLMFPGGFSWNPELLSRGSFRLACPLDLCPVSTLSCLLLD